MEIQEKTVGVSDLGLATLLVTLHFEVVDMERVDDKRVNFLFAQAEGIENAISNYWSGVSVFLSAQKLFSNHKVLKNRLYAFK
jgi:hypothetical protein